MTERILAQGAEAIISKQGSQVLKDRIKKSYRIFVLDNKLRKSRTKSEAKLLEKASQLISIPKVIETDNKEKIIMEFINGKKLSDYLDLLPNSVDVCEQIGNSIAKLHDNNIIHGDLTTSNMIYVENPKNNTFNNKTRKKENSSLKNNKELINNKKDNISELKTSQPLREEKRDKRKFKVYFIDFGLGFTSRRIEDKAVDLHLLRQALEAKHFQNWKFLFDAVLKGYNSKDKSLVLKQLEKVEARGRYRKNVQ